MMDLLSSRCQYWTKGDERVFSKEPVFRKYSKHGKRVPFRSFTCMVYRNSSIICIQNSSY